MRVFCAWVFTSAKFQGEHCRRTQFRIAANDDDLPIPGSYITTPPSPLTFIIIPFDIPYIRDVICNAYPFVSFMHGRHHYWIIRILRLGLYLFMHRAWSMLAFCTRQLNDMSRVPAKIEKGLFSRFKTRGRGGTLDVGLLDNAATLEWMVVHRYRVFDGQSPEVPLIDHQRERNARIVIDRTGSKWA